MGRFVQNAIRAARNPRLGANWLHWKFAKGLARPLAARLPHGGSIHGFLSFTDYWCFRPPSEAEYRLMERVVPAGGLALDVGANYGAFTIALGKLVPSASVHAFEPVPSVCTSLCQNIFRNGLSNVAVYNMAIADVPGFIRITNENTGTAANHIVCPGHPHSALTRCIGLDQFLDERRIDQVDFIKIDVEGFELAVLRGLAKSMASGRIRCMLIEVIPDLLKRHGSSVSDLLALIHAHDYRVFHLSTDGSRGKEASTFEYDIVGNWNYLVERPRT